MTKKKNIIIAIIAILVILLVTFLVFGKQAPSTNNTNNVQNNNQGNISTENKKELPTTRIAGTKTLDNLTFSDIRIVEEAANQNVLIANVKNNGTENVMDGVILNIELFEKDGKSIGILGGILPFVAADSTAEMKVPIAVNVMHTKDITFKFAEQ